MADAFWQRMAHRLAEMKRDRGQSDARIADAKQRWHNGELENERLDGEGRR